MIFIMWFILVLCCPPISLVLCELTTILTDLSSSSFTTTDVISTWTCFTQTSQTIVSDCGVYHILGGSNILGLQDYCQKTLLYLNPHYSLSMTMTLLKIDAWSSDYFYIYIDNFMVTSIKFQASDDPTVKFCPTTTTNDAIRSLSLNITHTAMSLTINLTTSAPSTTIKAGQMPSQKTPKPYWGIRDVIINIDTCDPSCATCSGPDPHQCLSCFSNAIHSLSGLCVCNIGFYMDFPINCIKSPCSICSLCHISCLSCSGGSSKACISCKANTYLYQGECMAMCPDGMYADKALYICQICDKTCFLCSMSSSNCTACKSYTYMYNFQCVAICPIGYYGDNIGNICKICDIRCDTCMEMKDNCSICVSGYYLYMQKCSMQCPDGTWQNNILNICQICDFPCFTCFGEGLNCTSCKNPYYLSNNNKCLTENIDGFFKSDGNIYIACNTECLKCDKSADNCSFCAENYVLNDNSCLSSCPSGRYVSSTISINPLCLACDQPCLTCSNTSTFCTSCPSPYLLQGSACTTHCSMNYYLDLQKASCLPCSSACSSCIAYNSSYCTLCSDPSLYVYKGECLTSCPSSTYIYSSECLETCPSNTYIIDEICYICNKNCMSCSSIDNCDVCNMTYYTRNNSGNCMKQKEIIAYIYDIDNPFSFKISFDDTFDYIDKFAVLCEIVINESLTNKNINYNSNIYIEDGVAYIVIIYEEMINNYTYIYIDFKQSNDDFYFILSNSSIKLTPFDTVCNDSESYYSDIDKKCIKKQGISLSLSYSSSSIKYLLKTSGIPSNLTNNINISSIFNIEITGGISNYIYTITTYEGSQSTYIISFDFKENIINGPILTATFNISMEEILRNNIEISSNFSSIKMIDYYIMSENEQKISNSANEFTNFADILNECNLYINMLLNGNSSFLMQGLMLLNLVFLLKFIKINYPPNLNTMFKARKDINNQFNLPKISINYNDFNILPENFQYYEISEYFLNNISSILLNIFIIIFIECFVLLIWHIIKKMCKFIKYHCLFFFIKFLKKLFIWACLFNIIFSKYQSIVFFIMTTLKFPPNGSFIGHLNLVITMFCLIFIVFFPFHIYKLIYLTKYLVISNNTNTKVYPVLIKDIDQPIITHKNIHGTSKSISISVDLFNKEKNKKIEDIFLFEEVSNRKGFMSDRSITPNVDKSSPKAVKFYEKSIFEEEETFKSLPSSLKNEEEVITETPSLNKLNKPRNTRIVTTDQNEINIIPVKIEDFHIPFKFTKFTKNIENSEKTLKNAENSEKKIFATFEEKLPEMDDFKEINKGISMENKFQNGALQEKEIKSMFYLFNGNYTNGFSSKTSINPSNNSIPLADDALKNKKKEVKISLFSQMSSPMNLKNSKENQHIILDFKKIDNNKGKKFDFQVFSIILSVLKRACSCILLKRVYQKLYNPNYQDITRFKKRFFFLWAEYKQNTVLQRFFVFIDFFRHYLIVLSIVVLYGYSIYQIACITAINLSFFILLLYTRPHHNKYLLILTIFNESIINIVLICVFKLAIYDYQENHDPSARQTLGWIIVFSNVILMYSLVLLTLFKIIRILIHIIKFIINRRNRNRKVCDDRTEKEDIDRGERDGENREQGGSKKNIEIGKSKANNAYKSDITVFDLWGGS